MEYILIILIILFIITIFYIWRSNKSINNKIKAIFYGHSALFWALKNKGIIDMKDWKEGNKIARGQKPGPMSLNDFMDLNKD